jgi:hypothetical protein
MHMLILFGGEGRSTIRLGTFVWSTGFGMQLSLSLPRYTADSVSRFFLSSTFRLAGLMDLVYALLL